jgi:hypothetical protein
MAQRLGKVIMNKRKEEGENTASLKIFSMN